MRRNIVEANHGFANKACPRPLARSVCPALPEEIVETNDPYLNIFFTAARPRPTLKVTVFDFLPRRVALT